MNSELTLRDKAKLTAKFYAFKKERDELNLFLVSFIADYTMLQNDEPSKRRRYLKKKYGLRTPRINYRFNTGEGYCWSVRNIAIVLGRDRSAITRVISRIRRYDSWNEKLSPLHFVIKSYEGGNIDVYQQDIFEVLEDFYEEEYLLRFARPRRGDGVSVPSLGELRRFWGSLRGIETAQRYAILPCGGEITFQPQSVIERILDTVWHVLRKIFGLLRRLIS